MYPMNHLRLFVASILVLILFAGCIESSNTPVSSPTPTSSEEEPQLEKYFQGFTGAFVLYDLNNDHYVRYNPERGSEQFLPASTFKILNSLIGLETGVIPDKNYTIQWDGMHYKISTWNQNHTLETAFQSSVVWYYQELARRVGEEKMQYYVDAVGYGNQDITGRIDSFWLDGAVRISADEQVELLKRLYRDDLPFSQRSLKIVKEIMILENTDTYRLSGKTGSGQVGTAYIGWFVGYVEELGNAYFFATNIEASTADAKGIKAKEITEDILQGLELLLIDNVHATPTLPQPTTAPTLQAPTATDVVTPSPTVTLTPTTPAPGSVLFDEDFEDGRAQDFTYMSGNWNVLLDETGNQVLDGDNRFKPQDPLSFGFGAAEWTDYALDYDIKLRNPTADVRMIFRNSDQGSYVHRLSLYYSHMAVFVSFPGDNWSLLKSRTYSFNRGVWYHVRLEVQGETIRAFINEKLEIETTDSQIHAGGLDFGVMAPTRVQLDNLRVTVLAPVTQGQP